MDESILVEGKKFLISYLKDKVIDYETIHPWRKNWEFIVLHSLRVEGYVKKILNMENKILSNDEVLTLRLAAILHDIGRIVKREGHAVIGRNIVEEWLRNNNTISKCISDPDRLLLMIERHSDKVSKESDYSLNVLLDADILDEIGVMSIFMTSNWIDKSNPYFFHLISDRIENFEIIFCDKEFELLNTKAAKEILDEKRKFIDLFNNQLKNELYGTEMFGELAIADLYSITAND
jgi:HD superfamily phosphodiesterase